ncbi:hypothetical protein R3P38DRAFT_1116629 [Favolaschia claudopus]|uniref:F-box domain-containing protein n=1 Tax=Favolaschia claudopus TaxID=2862362 RepID=A0AAW0B9C1_9AGAR
MNSARIELRAQAIDKEIETTNHHQEALPTLNSVVDPIAHLPLEISSEIFILCLPERPEVKPTLSPLLFLQICRSWRDIALSTPSLWSRIYCGRLAGVAAHNLHLWLSRAKTLPLTITISLPEDATAAIPTVLKKHAPQTKNLSVEVHSAAHAKAILTSFPILEVLELKLTYPWRGSAEFSKVCRDIICAAPRLLKCHILNLPERGDISSIYPTQIPCPCLRELELSDGKLLLQLTLPALESLSVKNLNLPHADLQDFLSRSKPPLRSLRFEVSHNISVKSLRLVPSLTNLTLVFNNYSAESLDVLSLLAADAEFLPNLREIIIRNWHHPRHDYDLLARVLEARSQLRSLRVFLPDPAQANYTPTNECVATLQSLSKQRSETHVVLGYDDYNYLSPES